MGERQRSNDQMQKLLINQQNQTTHLLQEQKQISVEFLNVMNKFTPS